MDKNKRFTTGKIVQRENITHDLWKIWLKTEEKLNFEPGQYCTVCLLYTSPSPRD